MIEFKSLNIERISEIEKLWYQNSTYHNKLSHFFSSKSNSVKFDDRVSTVYLNQSALKFYTSLEIFPKNIVLEKKYNEL